LSSAGFKKALNLPYRNINQIRVLFQESFLVISK